MSVALPFAIALGLAPLCERVLHRAGTVSVPNQRSSHTRPTTVGVGLVVPVAVLVAVMTSGYGLLKGVVAALVLGALGFADDIWDLSPAIRLGMQVAVALVGVFALSLPALLLIPAAVVLVAAVNGVNFMDGINGITSIHGVIFGLSLALAATATDSTSWLVVGLAISAACLGYLPNNFPLARSFPGDVLPYFLAGAYTLGLMDLARHHPAVLLGFGAFVPMALDTSVTILKRARSGESLVEGHRSHAYQRLARHTSHTSSSIVFAGLTLACAASLPISLGVSAAHGTLYSGLSIIVTTAALAAVPRDG